MKKNEGWRGENNGTWRQLISRCYFERIRGIYRHGGRAKLKLHGLTFPPAREK